MDTATPRSDDTLARQVRQAMCGVGYPQLRSVRCHAHGSTVTLTGQLASYYLSQVAQTIAGKISGVRQVVNRVQVASPQSDSRPEFETVAC
jgi:osmotically-inducible protein OsmY